MKIFLLAATLILCGPLYAQDQPLPQPEQPEEQPPEETVFTEDFPISECNFLTAGSNQFFSLTPGRITKFSGEEEGTQTELTITVLDQEKDITLPEIGNITTRIIEERELVDGRLKEISLNYFALCEGSNDIYYFGEDVRIIQEDGSISEEGSWLAGENEARPGLIMPGTFLIGSRYAQEIAPEIAQDRAEHTATGLEFETQSGILTDCVEITETTPLQAEDVSKKIYCPEVGLVQDDFLKISELPQPAPEQPEEQPEGQEVPTP